MSFHALLVCIFGTLMLDEVFCSCSNGTCLTEGPNLFQQQVSASRGTVHVDEKESQGNRHQKRAGETCESRGKPECEVAGVQSPRDLSNGAQGSKPAQFTPLTEDQASKLVLTNLHFHLGAEHKVEGQYDDATDSTEFDADSSIALIHPRPGFMCPIAKFNLRPEELEEYKWEYCEHMQVGKTYEFHSVWSSGAPTEGAFNDTLANAAGSKNGYFAPQENPMILVQAQMFVVVNDTMVDRDVAERYDGTDLLTGWIQYLAKDKVAYAGSTTGTSHDNECCSPYDITWHVDRECHLVSAQAFDNACKRMKEEFKFEDDIMPHGSRVLVDTKWVVPSDEVFKF